MNDPFNSQQMQSQTVTDPPPNPPEDDSAAKSPEVGDPAPKSTEVDPAPKPREDNPAPDDDPASKSFQIDLLKQILEVLQNSTIAEERGQDTSSKFWAAYKKVSSQYDGDMLERCNGNMDIVLIFAGLFSAVNTAFIISMQPNPVDTTNILLFQLINGLSTVQLPSTLPAPTGYPSAPVWAQTLAYASLAFSLLAAFGAVLGKQWLGYYKTSTFGLETLEARCKQRQRKFENLQTWQFQNMLQSFPLLLQMPLLLFELSLGAELWTQQPVISILIFATAGLGFLGYIFASIASVVYPDCPFQTPVSFGFLALIRYLRPGAISHPPRCRFAYR